MTTTRVDVRRSLNGGRSTPASRAVGWLFLLASAPTLLGGIWSAITAARLVVSGVSTPAERVIPGRRSYPTIEFTAGDGRRYRFEARASYYGSEAQVRYLPHDPGVAMIESDGQLWWPPLMMIAVSLGFAGAGWALATGRLGLLRSRYK